MIKQSCYKNPREELSKLFNEIILCFMYAFFYISEFVKIMTKK